MTRQKSKKRVVLLLSLAIALLAIFGAGTAYVFAGTAGPIIITAPYATNIDSSSAQIMWTTDDLSDGMIVRSTTPDPSADPNAVTLRYRCDTNTGTTMLNHCINFLDMLPSTTYYYQVISSNTTGSTTASGSLTTLSSSAMTTPGVPQNFTGSFLASGGQFTPSVRFTWSDGKWEDQYKLYWRPQGGNWILGSNFPQNVVTGQLPGYSSGVYEYKIQACNSVTQLCSADSSIVSITMPTTSAPPPTVSPVTLISSSISKNTLTAGEIQTATAAISSSAALANLIVDIRIYNSSDILIANKEFNPVNIAAGATATFQYDYQSSAGMIPGTYTVQIGVWGPNYAPTYLYVVPQTFSVVLPPPDTTPPSTPPNFSAVPYSSTESRLTWGVSTDSVGVTAYKIFRNSTLVTTITTSGTYAYIDSALAPGTYYSYFIKAVDAAGNESASAYATLMMPITATTTIPLAPTNLHVVTSATAGFSLAWTDNATNEDHWNIERKLSSGTAYSTLSQTLPSNTTTYTDTSASQGVLYDYRVQACLSGAGCSGYATLSGVSFDNEKPVAPTAMTATALSSTRVEVSWSGATDNVGVVGYRLFRNGVFYLGLTGASYTDSNVTPDTLYTYSVKAVDAANNESLTATSRDVHTPTASVTSTSTTTISTPSDTSAPTPPTTISRIASSTSISLQFSGATDNVGVVAYKIYRNGISVAKTYYPYYVDYGLQSNTTYSYYLRSVDAALNESAPSETISVTTLALAATSPEVTTTSTTTALVTTTTPIKTTATKTVTMSVFPGTSVCDGTTRKTKMTFTATPSTGANFKLVRNRVDVTTKVPGTYELLNGAYYWEAVANPGFVLDGTASGDFVFNKLCDITTTMTATPPPPPPASATGEDTTNLVVSSVASPEPVAVVSTQEQYIRYCDDPLHRAECEAYATTKIITPSAEEAPAAPGATPSTAAATSEEATQVLAQRVGVRMFQDTDGDGITDYDEVNIYDTDPKNADTDGDSKNDGDELLSGSNPLASTRASSGAATPTPAGTMAAITSDIVYEDPKVAGDVKPQLLAVTDAKGVVQTDPESGATTTSVVFSGMALPNSFVTLYIFSDPIVIQVKADESGAWVYTLDRELPDGSHEVVSAITDTGGRILAKSDAVPFVKVASAVSFGSAELLPAESAPSFFSGTYFYLIVALFALLLIVSLGVIGIMVKQRSAVREGGDGGVTFS